MNTYPNIETKPDIVVTFTEGGRFTVRAKDEQTVDEVGALIKGSEKQIRYENRLKALENAETGVRGRLHTRHGVAQTASDALNHIINRR